MISRRSFLIGVGGLVTAKFVTRAKDYAVNTAQPLLLNPGRAEETLYLQNQESWSDDNKWRLSLGPYDGETEPSPPTWRLHLQSQGYLFDTEADLRATCREVSLSPEELDDPLPGLSWADYWERAGNPEARAYWLLKELNLDCPLTQEGRKAGRIEFLDSPNPCSSWHWVELQNDLSASLLQARLIELGHPLRLVVSQV
jgi:hypothetical protein